MNSDYAAILNHWEKFENQSNNQDAKDVNNSFSCEIRGRERGASVCLIWKIWHKKHRSFHPHLAYLGNKPGHLVAIENIANISVNVHTHLEACVYSAVWRKNTCKRAFYEPFCAAKNQRTNLNWKGRVEAPAWMMCWNRRPNDGNRGKLKTKRDGRW